MVELRLWLPDRRGLLACFSIVTVTKFADAGAYFAGRFLGRHKLCPNLSPKKTVEGAVGGIVAAALGGWAYWAWVIPAYDMEMLRAEGQGWAILGFSLSMAVAGMLGDLSISLFKRDADQKDSAKILPGLGGSLDVLDSILWAAPVGFLWWASGVFS